MWLGRLSMSSVVHLFSYVSRAGRLDNQTDNNVVVVGFVYFWASWCHPRQLPSKVIESKISPVLKELVNQLNQKHPNILTWKWNQMNVFFGHVQVDESKESEDLYIDDNRFLVNGHNQRGPCPPEELPTLAVVIQTSANTHAFLHYLTSFPTTIWSKCGHSIDSISITEDWIPAVVTELENLPKDFVIQTELNGSIDSVQRSHDNDDDHYGAIRIFVAGDRSSVGKSSVCLGMLGNLVQTMGYAPSSLAYIKPATQCEAPQLVQAYCDQVGIECVPVGPIVYYKGFTRAFLAGETESSAELLAKASDAVDRIARGKRIILIDGVGFPAVGSICGTDNAAVARACGYLSSDASNGASTTTRPSRYPMAVLLVGGSGVGAAVDAFQLNATYFEMHQVPVIGAIFNKLELDGFYSLEDCRTQVTAYFSKNQRQQELGRQPFGFVPIFPSLAAASSGMEQVDDWIRLFGQHVNVPGIVEAAKQVKDRVGESVAFQQTVFSQDSEQPAKKIKLSSSLPLLTTSNVLSRSDIEQRAIGAGAAPSA